MDYSLSDAAKQYKVSTRTIQRWARDGKINSSKTPGGRNRYSAITINGTPITPATPQVEAVNNLLKALPPAGGSWALPNIQQFVGIIQSISRFYKNPDIAIQNSPANARAMFANLTIREPLQARMLAVAELPWHIEPENPKDAQQMIVAEGIKDIIESIPDFLKYRYSLLYAIWFGKYGVQNKMEWDWRKGFKRLVVKDWSPVHGDSILWKWDSADVGIYTGVSTGFPGTRAVTTEPGYISRAHVLDDSRESKTLSLSERQAFVIHTHDYMAGEFLDPQSAGGVKGLGLRSTLYWTWYVQNELIGMLIDLIERVGTGITIWRYLRGNQESYNAVKTIAESQSSQAALMFPVDPSMTNQSGREDVERIEPSPVGIDNILKVSDDYFGSMMRRMIVGQDATSRPVPSGLNSDTSKTHENTFNRIVRYDALNLAETLTRDLVSTIQDWTYPEARFKCRFVINVDRPDPKTALEAVKLGYEMGVSFNEDEVRELTGMSKPDPLTDNILKRQALPTPDLNVGLKTDPNAPEKKAPADSVDESEPVQDKP